MGSVVVDGLITVEEVDVAKFISGRLPDPLQLPISDLMHAPVVSVLLTTSAEEVVRLLLDHGYRSLPVVDSDRRVVGIITDADLLERTGLHARLSLQGFLSEEEFRQQFAASGPPV